MSDPASIIGIKSTTWAPAVLGAMVYAMRKGEAKWYWRLTSALVGTVTAVYLGEATVMHLGVTTIEGYNAVIFLMGLLGVSLTEALIGAASDPKVLLEVLRSRLPK